MTLTTADILSLLYIVVAVMIIIVLYHVLFIVVDLRKSMRRVENISEAVEAAVIKPLAIADKALDWAITALIGSEDDSHHHKHHGHHKKD